MVSEDRETEESAVSVEELSPRRPGRPPVINRDAIVAAARSLNAHELTMQSVADVLGVHRKSLHYYVKDREGLLELVALDVFESEFRRITLPSAADWRELLVAVCRAMRTSLIEVGSLLTYADLRGAGGIEVLALHEGVLQSMIAAGFTIEEAGLAYAQLSDIAYCGAREAMIALKEAQRAQTKAPSAPEADIRDAMITQGSIELPVLAQLVEVRGAEGYRDKQFEFGIWTLIAALEKLLASESD